MNSMTDIFNTDRDQAALVTLSAALEAGIIHNADYKNLKDSINRSLEAAWNTLIKQPYLSIDYDERQSIYGAVVTDNLYYGSGPQIHNLKSVLKRIAKVGYDDPECDLLPIAIKLCDAIEPVINDMNTLKGMVVKGRKPSTEPRMTPERTIENTGTCSVCSRNVKLRKNGKIYDHGYTVQWHEQQGNCFGVDFDPIEISTEGLVAWLENATNQRDRLAKQHTTLEARPATVNEQVSQGYRKPTKTVSHEQGSPRYERILETNIRTTARNIELADRTIVSLKEQITNWKPSALPSN